MAGSSLSLSNKQARHLWLSLQSMSAPPCGKRQSAAFAQRIESLGMVQLDSIGIVSRAHHHILWSRQSAYRSAAYDTLLQTNRDVFEHFSHDAVILPMSTYPYWQRQHKRRSTQYSNAVWGKEMADKKTRNKIIDHIANHGAVCSRDFTKVNSKPANRSAHAWARPAHKLALDYLWLEGTLSVSHRKNFTKFYDLTERVIPAKYRESTIPEQEQINWLCESAIQRLGFASASEIQKFWEACSLNEVQAWLKNPSIDITQVSYLDSHGEPIEAYAIADIEEHLERVRNPSSRIRIVSPFDPIVRDRARVKRLFDFEYRIEIYTPQAKRKFGYYVYPIVEGDRFVGRIEVRANRKTDTLDTYAWWLEPKVKPTTARINKLVKELERLSKLAGVSCIAPLPKPSKAPC